MIDRFTTVLGTAILERPFWGDTGSVPLGSQGGDILLPSWSQEGDSVPLGAKGVAAYPWGAKRVTSYPWGAKVVTARTLGKQFDPGGLIPRRRRQHGERVG